ncbi:MAG: 30S ribosome-binding factor RbfA [Deltaproteobacteria bacterium]|nr:30S ribosome-binding factor RbfA [Deltaproteobacteria bacterium]
MYKKERKTERVHAFLAEEIRRLGDPCLGFISITGIKLSPDGRVARIYWSYFGAIGNSANESAFLNREEIAAVDAALKKATKFLRRRIGEELELRYVPELIFEYDSSVETGARIDMLLEKAGL